LNNPGLRQFKNGWGTREYFIPYYRYDLGGKVFVPEKKKESGFPKRVFRGMPLPLLNWVGSSLYRHMG
jgi:hypothetical protein